MVRTVVKNFPNLSPQETKTFLTSPWHEERLFALLVLVRQYECGDAHVRQRIAGFYVRNRRYINNWDLVDVSADKILGAHCFENSSVILYKLAKSKNLWDRRIAILATFFFIRKGQYSQTLRIAGMLLKDKQDLIHKAVGWMLREMGKRSLSTEETFLKRYAKVMPRTMLRYAIERFPETKRQQYLDIKH
jgi:3-methyladenine DNA glycosylase AlkD